MMTVHDDNDIRAAVPIPYPWGQVILPYFLGGLVAIALIAGLLAWRRRRNLAAEAEKKKAPPYDPVAAAILALVRLRNSPRWSATALKDACEELARIGYLGSEHEDQPVGAAAELQ